MDSQLVDEGISCQASQQLNELRRVFSRVLREIHAKPVFAQEVASIEEPLLALVGHGQPIRCYCNEPS